MSHATYLIGDVFDRMRELPDNSVDLVLTSPPFLALRSYLPEDHPNKAKEIGSEPNPAEFVDVLLALSAEWRRVLAPHGSIAIELGDTFSGSGGGGGDYYDDGLRAGQPGFTGSANASRQALKEANARHWREKNADKDRWPLPKSLALVPEAYRFALAYGHNPHTGTESPAGQWRVRNVIRWVRPNPPVGALGDKFRPATSEMVVATIASDRFFDLDAVRGPLSDRAKLELAAGGVKGGESYQGEASDWSGYKGERTRLPAAGGGAPPLDWWKISTKGYAGAHYAVWPAELCVKPIKAMCPEQVCRECGEPSRRISGEPTYEFSNNPTTGRGRPKDQAGPAAWGDGRPEQRRKQDGGMVRITETIGFTDCGHNNWRPGIVLDPFAGTGTTLAVATGHGRDAIGIDIDERNALLAEERIGPMFLTIEGAT